jgi:hypothetical protein
MNENILDSILFFLFSCGALFAVSRLFSQLLNRRRLRAQDATPQLEERLARIEQIVESTAVEVERVAEANRFMSKLLAERSADRGIEASVPRPSARVITPH